MGTRLSNLESAVPSAGFANIAETRSCSDGLCIARLPSATTEPKTANFVAQSAHSLVVQHTDQHAHARAHRPFRVSSIEMRWWSIALVALIGCDKLFDVDHVDSPSTDAQVFDVSPDASFPCPGSYIAFPEAPEVSRYRWGSPKVTWQAAELDCEDDSPFLVTHLVVFDRPGEMAVVRDTLDGMFGGFAAHAGYARNVLDNPYEFYAVTGEALPVSGPPWNMNEPTGVIGAGEETTVRFESFADLTDQPWDSAFSFLCECDQRPVTKTFQLVR
jgi:hypothetical protein